MTVRTILDAGALVAFLKRSETQHRWAIAAFKQLPADGMVTCAAVISEACFLLQRTPSGVDILFRWLSDGRIALESVDSDSAAIHALLKKYRNVPASYADACIVRLSERHPDATVVTTDSDFTIYRRNDRKAIPLVAPFVDPT